MVNRIKKLWLNIKTSFTGQRKPHFLYKGNPGAVILKTGLNLVPLIDPAQKGPVLKNIQLIRAMFQQESGYDIGGVRVMDDLELEDNQYKIEIAGKELALNQAYIKANFVNKSVPELNNIDIEAFEGINPVNRKKAAWVSENQVEKLIMQGIPFLNTSDYISTHLSYLVKQYVRNTKEFQDQFWVKYNISDREQDVIRLELTQIITNSIW